MRETTKVARKLEADLNTMYSRFTSAQDKDVKYRLAKKMGARIEEFPPVLDQAKRTDQYQAMTAQAKASIGNAYSKACQVKNWLDEVNSGQSCGLSDEDVRETMLAIFERDVPEHCGRGPARGANQPIDAAMLEKIKPIFANKTGAQLAEYFGASPVLFKQEKDTLVKYFGNNRSHYAVNRDIPWTFYRVCGCPLCNVVNDLVKTHVELSEIWAQKNPPQAAEPAAVQAEQVVQIGEVVGEVVEAVYEVVA